MPMRSQNSPKPLLVQRASQSPRTHFTAVPALCTMSTTQRLNTSNASTEALGDDAPRRVVHAVEHVEVPA